MLANILISVVLAAAVVASIRAIQKRKKSGTCGCADCTHCDGHCREQSAK